MKQMDFFTRLLARISSPVAKVPTAKPAIRRPAGRNDEALAATCRSWLESLGASALGERLVVTWSPRLRSTAGLAYPGRALIKLNPRLREFGDAEVDRTLRHELAHLLAHFRAGRRRIAPHGPEWRCACADLGLADEARCHNLPLPRKTVRRPHLYRCPKCGAEIRRVRPFRRPSACLKCCRSHSGGRYDDRFRLVKVKATTGS